MTHEGIEEKVGDGGPDPTVKEGRTLIGEGMDPVPPTGV